MSRRAIGACATLTALALAACSSGSNSSPNNAPSTSQAPSPAPSFWIAPATIEPSPSPRPHPSLNTSSGEAPITEFSTRIHTGYESVAPAGQLVSHVQADWVQPASTCSDYVRFHEVAFWIGVQGLDDKTLQQIGTSVECYQNRVYYFAWYEFYPEAVVYKDLPLHVRPGDVIHTEIAVKGPRFTMSIEDGIEHFTISRSYSATPRTTAIWNVEAPSDGSPMVNFGTMEFTSAWATLTMAGRVSIGSGAWQRVYRDTAVSAWIPFPRCVAGPLNADQTAFPVTWRSE